MNFIFWVLSVSVSVFKLTHGAGDTCEDNGHEGDWTCQKNEDNDTLSVTYDCSANNDTDVEIWLWSLKFPPKIATLIIQNCKNVHLYTGHVSKSQWDAIKKSYKINFTCLKFINISNLEQKFELPSEWYKKYLPGVNNYTEKAGTPEKLPKATYLFYFMFHLDDVIFENVTLVNFSYSFFPDRNLEIIKFLRINNNNFEVIRLPASNFKTIEISYSNFSDMNNVFNIINATQIIVSRNFFKKSAVKRTIFDFEAEKIVMTDNVVECLHNNFIKFTSKNIQILNNDFHEINENALYSMSQTDETPENGTLRKSFNFSDNLIYYLQPDALKIPPVENFPGPFTDDLTINNNSINCDCKNKDWFDSIFQMNRYIEESLYYSKWSMQYHQNKCLNIPNCFISHVLKNYEELCKHDFSCSKSLENALPNYTFINIRLKTMDEILTKLYNFTIKINQNASRLENLVEQFENINMKDFDNKLKEESSRVSVVNSWLIVLSILFCCLVIYTVMIKCLQISFIKVLMSKYGFKSKTRLNDAEVGDIILL